MATLDQSASGTANNTTPVARVSAQTKIAQGFTVSVDGLIDSVKLGFCVGGGSPSDNIVVGIYSDDGSGKPNVLLSSEETYPASSITPSYPTVQWVTFTFSSKVTGENGTLYHIVISRSGAVDINSWVNSYSIFPEKYAGGTTRYYDGSNWGSSASVDTNFEEYYTPVIIEKNLSEVINAISLSSKSNSRTKLETVKAISSKLFTVNRTLAQSIVINQSFISAAELYRIFSQTIMVLSSKITSFSRSLVQSIVVTPVYSRVITSQRNFTDTVIVNGIGNFLGTFYKVLTENFIVTGIFNIAGSFYKILSDTVTVISSKSYSYGRTFLLTIQVAGSAIISSGRDFIESIIISTLKGVMNYSKTIKQYLTVTDFTDKILPARVFTQNINVSSITSLLLVALKDFYEVISAVTSVVLLRPARTLYESVIVAFYVSKSLPARVYDETISAVAVCVNMAGKFLTEVISVISTFLREIGKIISEVVIITGYVSKYAPKILSETIQVVSSLLHSTTRIFTEICIVSSSYANQAGWTFLEAISVSGTYVLDNIYKVLTEIIQVFTQKTVGFARNLQETVEVDDEIDRLRTPIFFTEAFSVVSSFTIDLISKVLNEVIMVISVSTNAIARVFSLVITAEDSFTRVFVKEFIEVITAVSSFVKLLGHLFTENILFWFNKTYIILNGIMVGTWRKIARITSTIWRHLPRI